MNVEFVWRAVGVTIVGLAAFAPASALAQARAKPATPKSKVHMTVTKDEASGRFIIRAWEELPKGEPRTASGPGGGGAGSAPGVLRCRDLHWFPPPGTKINGEPVAGSHPDGWQGRGSGGVLSWHATTTNAGGLSTDPNNPTTFSVTPGSNAGESTATSLVATNDAKPQPPGGGRKRDWDRMGNVNNFITGDSDRPLPGPIAFIDVPDDRDPWEVTIGSESLMTFTYNYPNVPYLAHLYTTPAPLDTTPATLAELLEAGAVLCEEGGHVEIMCRALTAATGPDGEGTVMIVSDMNASAKTYYLLLAVDDVRDDGAFPSALDLQSVIRVSISE